MYTKTIQECIGQRHPKYSSRGSQVPLRLILDPAFSLSRSFSKSLNQFSSRTHFRYYPMHTHHTPTAVSAYIITLVTRIQRTCKQHAAALTTAHEQFYVRVFNTCVIENMDCI